MRNRRSGKYRRRRPQDIQLAWHLDQPISAIRDPLPHSGCHSPVDLALRETCLDGLTAPDHTALLARQLDDCGLKLHCTNVPCAYDTIIRRVLWADNDTHCGVEPWVSGTPGGYRLGG